MPREVKVGLLVIAALVVLGAGIFLVGEQNRLFTRKNEYTIHFERVGGLARGGPVQLNGVTVGRVEDVVLPESMEEELLVVRISIERRYAERIREDSTARIKTLGLLGDKFVDITVGSPAAAQIVEGGEIPAAAATDVDKIIASGGDVVENVVAMSVSLREIIARTERGEGLLGELTTEEGLVISDLKDSVRQLLASLDSVTRRVDRGEGLLGRLVTDEELADTFSGSVARLESTIESFESGEGPLPDLLNNPESRDRVREILDHLSRTTDELSQVVADFRSGDGVLPRLISDPEMADEIGSNLRQLVENLNQISGKINAGDGTVGQLINDPSVYEAVDDILVGIDESKFLRWLVRNRQKKGIDVRYEEAQDELEQAEDGTDPQRP